MNVYKRNIINLITVLTVFTFFPFSVPGLDSTDTPVKDYPGSLNLPNRHTVWPEPGIFRIGNAVAPVNYWMTAWTVNDVMKMAGFGDEIGSREESTMWVPVIDGRWEIGRRGLVPVDRDGWPRSMKLTDGRQADRYVTIIMGDDERPAAFPAGEYRFLYSGSGEIFVEGAEITEREPGRMVLDYNGRRTLIISIRYTDPNNHLRDMRLYRPDAGDGERFNAVYLEYLRPFSVIRPLHFFGEELSYGRYADWDRRKRVGYSHWGGSWGAPYEAAADLANQSASDLWLNIPIAADDGYVRSLAALMLRELDRERKVYLELGNELWNYVYPYALGREYALETAEKRWPGVLGAVRPYSDGDRVSENMMIYSWQGVRTVEIRKIFNEVWGAGSDRLYTVLAAQIGGSHPNWHPSRYLLETPVYTGEEGAEPCGYQVDAFAVAPYISEPEGQFGFSRNSPEAFISDAVTYVRGEGKWKEGSNEEGLRWSIRNDKRLAEEFGLPLIAYEGGQHFTGSAFTRDVINVHPAMSELYKVLFQVWQEEGGGLFVHFAGIIPRGQNEPGTEPGYYESENFGIKEYQTQSRESSPKWDAVLKVMEQIGQLK